MCGIVHFLGDWVSVDDDVVMVDGLPMREGSQCRLFVLTDVRGYRLRLSAVMATWLL